MNWIDKKYKDQLGNRQFDDGLRQRGKKDLEKLLAKEMPVERPGSGSGPGVYAGIAGTIIIFIAIAVGVWYWQQPDENHSVAPVMEQQPVVNPVENEKDVNLNELGEHPEEGASTGLEDVVNPQMNNSTIAEDVASADKSTAEKVPENMGEGLPMKPTRQDGVVQEFDPQINPDEGKVNPLAVPLETDSDVLKDGANRLVAEFEDKPSEATLGGVQDTIIPTEINENKKIAHTRLDTVNAKEESDELSPSAPLKEQKNRDDAGADRNLVEEKMVLDGNKSVMTDTSGQDLEPVVEVQDDASSVEEESANISSAEAELYNLAFRDFKEPSGTFEISDYKAFSPRRFSMSLWTGYTFVGKRIKGVSDEYQALRKEEEEAIWTVPTGVSIDYHINRNWTLSIGTGWAEYGEVLKYDYQWTDSISNLDGRYDSPKNYGNIIHIDSTRIVDSIFLGHWNYNFSYISEDSTIKNNNGRTNWRYIEVPIMVGYRFGKGRVRPWLQTGISLGIPYSSSYRYIAPTGEGLQPQEEARASRASFQYNYLLQLGADYYLGSRWSVRFNIIGSYQLNPSYQFSGIEQHYYRVGGTLGIGYIF